MFCVSVLYMLVYTCVYGYAHPCCLMWKVEVDIKGHQLSLSDRSFVRPRVHCLK